MFAKRLVNQLSASDDSESSMISKLKVRKIKESFAEKFFFSFVFGSF